MPIKPLPEDLSTVEDFLQNESFRTWVLEKRTEDQVYWQWLLAKHPEKIDLYEQAVAVLLTLQGKTETLTNEQVKDKAQQILVQMPVSHGLVRPLFNKHWGKWAAVAATVSLLVWWQLGGSISSKVVALKGEARVLPSTDDWKIVRNATHQPLVVLLPDNSSVLLTTGSQLRFRKRMKDKVRAVFLQGEGFFEVTKNPDRPFIVYTASLTTKVLGTSFQVHSFDQEKTAYVKVKTGKVTVTPVNEPDRPVVLKVNEELKLGTGQGTGVKTTNFLSDEKPSDIIAQQFSFSYVAVPEIFDQLEASYHMPIRYDRSLLGHCTFTGKLDDMPFLEKIQLICLAIESTYEIVDNQVVIHSRGCS